MCHFCFEGSLSKNILTGKAVVIVVIGHSLWLVTLPLQKFMLWQFITISGGFRTPWYLNIWPLLCCSKVCHTELWMIHIENTDGACWVFFYASQQHTVQVSLYDCDIFRQCQQKNQTTHFQCQFWPVLGRCAQCTGQKGTAISELHWIYERKLQDKSRQNSILSPSENPLSNARDTWVSHNKIVNLICFNCILLNYNV